MPVNGCVSGCALSTKCHGRRLGGFLPKACTPRLGLSGLLSGSAAFRERSRDVSSGSRMRENCMSGSTSGMWKRSMVWIMRHRQTKEPETDRPDLTHRATSRLYSGKVVGFSVQVADVTRMKELEFELHAAK